MGRRGERVCEVKCRFCGLHQFKKTLWGTVNFWNSSAIWWNETHCVQACLYFHIRITIIQFWAWWVQPLWLGSFECIAFSSIKDWLFFDENHRDTFATPSHSFLNSKMTNFRNSSKIRFGVIRRNVLHCMHHKLALHSNTATRAPPFLLCNVFW